MFPDLTVEVVDNDPSSPQRRNVNPALGRQLSTKSDCLPPSDTASILQDSSSHTAKASR